MKTLDDFWPIILVAAMVLALFAACETKAQPVTVTGETIAISVPEEASYPRDVTKIWSDYGAFLDIFSAVRVAGMQGIEVEIPPIAQDSVLILLDELRAIEDSLNAIMDEATATITNQQQTIDNQSTELANAQETISRHLEEIEFLASENARLESRLQAIADELRIIIDTKGASYGRLRQILDSL